MSDRFDAIVVGVGAMGSAACFQLARRGLRVLGLEQFGVAHDRGSSHGRSRMIRTAYYEHPDYVPLLRRAYELWDELGAMSGEPLLYRTGGVYVGPPDGGLVAGSLASARLHGLPHEELSPTGLRDRFPQFRIPDTWRAVVEPAAGFLAPEAVVAAYARLARAAGAAIYEHEPVSGWAGDGGDSSDLVVRTSRGAYRTKRLVVCGGPWSGRLLADLGVPLVVTRQVLGWVTPADPTPFALGAFPVWAAENPDGTLQYGFPIMPGERTLKVAWHGAGTPTDPDAVDRATSGADAATFLPQLPHLLPDAAGPVAEMKVCLYTNSPDHRFVIDRHPRDPRVTVACGFSGHGFKFASVVGEVLSELVTDGRSKHPVGFLGTGRFATRH
ncbi:MAG TPA: N-methyl-L-tryptophan oxidase [Humisphaera sp.]